MCRIYVYIYILSATFSLFRPTSAIPSCPLHAQTGTTCCNKCLTPSTSSRALPRQPAPQNQTHTKVPESWHQLWMSLTWVLVEIRCGESVSVSSCDSVWPCDNLLGSCDLIWWCYMTDISMVMWWVRKSDDWSIQFYYVIDLRIVCFRLYIIVKVL